MDRSRAPYSNQVGPHPDLAHVVRRHMQSEYLRPISTPTRKVFEQLQPQVAQHDGDLILDAGCGDGRSTATLALRYPHALVLGVDKSRRRLQGHLDERPFMRRGNLILCRANLIDFWRLAATAGWRLARHYLLYPNPWPKKQHLRRRWHGHAVLPAILALGGRLEVRSNWRDYTLEFAQALAVAGMPCEYGRLNGPQALSPFEKKYHDSGHGLYYWVSLLPARYGMGHPRTTLPDTSGTTTCTGKAAAETHRDQMQQSTCRSCSISRPRVSAGAAIRSRWVWPWRMAAPTVS